MPIIDGIGYSEYTAQKQADFAYLVGYHLNVAGHMITRAAANRKTWPPWEYWYFDITAGKGTCPETDAPGSPLIFATEARQKGVRARALLFEKEPENCASLREHLADYPECTVIPGDHTITLMPSIPEADRPHLGLLYCDTSGTYPPFPLLAEFASNKLTERVDLLLYVSATTIKRCCGAFPDKGFQLLSDGLASISKATWIIREPQGRHQWTFICGSKWEGLSGFPKRGFYKLNTDEGQAILRRLTYKGGANGQPPVLDLPGVPEPSPVPTGANRSHAAQQGAV